MGFQAGLARGRGGGYVGGGGVKARNKVKFQPKVHLFSRKGWQTCVQNSEQEREEFRLLS